MQTKFPQCPRPYAKTDQDLSAHRIEKDPCLRWLPKSLGCLGRSYQRVTRYLLIRESRYTILKRTTKIQKYQIRNLRAGTELSRFNLVNIMAADALAPYVARTSISSHGIDYVEYVGLGLTWGNILSTCVISMWNNDIKCKYMFCSLRKI